MKIIIAEKPDVAKQIVHAIAPSASFNLVKSSSKGRVGYYENSQFVICYSVGHIVSIPTPKDISDDFDWSLAGLPWDLPADLPTVVSADKKDIFAGIQKAFSLHDYDEVIVATDGDREGQNIWRKIRLHLKHYSPKKESRMWIDEWTKEGIEKAYNNRFPNFLKENLGLAAQVREEEDWKWGMEATVACTKQYGDGGGVVSIGRVMGPTMKFAVDLENQIKNFKPEPYKVVSIETDTDEPGKTITLKHKVKSGERLSVEDADKFAENLKKERNVALKVAKKKTRKKCPELYDGTTILQDMNSKYGYSADKTAAIIQKLYQEYVLTTYPGTNDTQISEGTAKMAYDAFKNMTDMYSDEINEIKSNGWTVSSHVVTTKELPHEAITPVFGTAHTENISKLSTEEMNVYKAICERFLAVFYPDAEFLEVTVSGELCNETFQTSGKTLEEEGWTKILGIGKDTVLPNVTDGKIYNIVNIGSEEKMTTPPSRFTEASIIDAMKHAGRYIDDKTGKEVLKSVEGLGTARTRPGILKNIKAKGYFEVKKKTIIPTEKCMKLFEVLPEDSPVSSPMMTAINEQRLTEVENGTLSKDECIKIMDKELFDFINKVKTSKDNGVINGSAKQSASSSLVCPFCGSAIRENTKSYYCQDYKGCGFHVWKTISGKKISQTALKQLCTKKKTSKIDGFTSKKGTKFSAFLTVGDDKEVHFEFPPRK